MNTTTLRTTVRRKRVWIPAVATVAVLGVGGAGLAYAANADDSQPVTGSDRDRVAQAAVDEVGGGEALEVETSDDRGEAYEVDVLDTEGVEWHIALAEDLTVVDRERDDDRGDHDDDHDDDRGPRGPEGGPAGGPAGGPEGGPAGGPEGGLADGPEGGPAGGPDADDAPVTGPRREQIAAVAVEEVGSGEATKVERTNDAPEAFEVEVVDDEGVIWDVSLDADLGVLSRERDS